MLLDLIFLVYIKQLKKLYTDEGLEPTPLTRDLITNSNQSMNVRPVQPVNKSYTISPTTQPSVTNANDFLTESKILNNELDEVITYFGMDSKDEYFGGSIMYGGELDKDDTAKRSNLSTIRNELIRKDRNITKKPTKDEYMNYITLYEEYFDHNPEIVKEVFYKDFYNEVKIKLNIQTAHPVSTVVPVSAPPTVVPVSVPPTIPLTIDLNDPVILEEEKKKLCKEITKIQIKNITDASDLQTYIDDIEELMYYSVDNKLGNISLKMYYDQLVKKLDDIKNGVVHPPSVHVSTPPSTPSSNIPHNVTSTQLEAFKLHLIDEIDKIGIDKIINSQEIQTFLDDIDKTIALCTNGDLNNPQLEQYYETLKKRFQKNDKTLQDLIDFTNFLRGKYKTADEAIKDDHTLGYKYIKDTDHCGKELGLRLPQDVRDTYMGFQSAYNNTHLSQNNQQPKTQNNKVNVLKTQENQILMLQTELIKEHTTFKQKVGKSKKRIDAYVTTLEHYTVTDMSDKTTYEYTTNEDNNNKIITNMTRDLGIITWMIHEVIDVNNATEFIRDFKNYRQLDDTEKGIIEEVFLSGIYTFDKLEGAMKANNIRFNYRERNEITYGVKQFSSGDLEVLFQIFIGETNDTPNDKITISKRKELSFKLKAINNSILQLLNKSITFMKNRFVGANYQIINDIKELYDDIGDKVHIITTLKIENEQLKVMDLTFKKLYTTVETAISLYVPPTSGGSIYGGHMASSLSKPKYNGIRQLFML